jgi:hypothetical protein
MHIQEQHFLDLYHDLLVASRRKAITGWYLESDRGM